MSGPPATVSAPGDRGATNAYVLSLRHSSRSPSSSAKQRVQSAALRDTFERLRDKETFEPGQLIYWKTGLRNRTRPVHGEPCIVVGYVEKDVVDPGLWEAGSPYFLEPLDLQIGLLDADGDLEVIHVDSRRFTGRK